jgi:hypothetical protein
MDEPPDPREAPLAPSPRPTVLYVMGAGRSGSTILGVALGNCESVFFAGELDRWLARAGVPREGGEERTRLWRQVREQVGEADDVFAFNTPLLERSSTALKLRTLPRQRRMRDRYREVSENLYLAIADVTGASHIVDSSHYPRRARQLRALRRVELHLLFLVRDPQAVVASLGRRDVPERRFGELAANAYLWLTYLFSLFVFLRHPRERRLFVRHEDFLADPERVLGEILKHTGADASPPDLGALRAGAPFHGNRLIRDERIALRAAPEHPRRSAVTRILQLPWAIVFAWLRPAAS